MSEFSRREFIKTLGGTVIAGAATTALAPVSSIIQSAEAIEILLPKDASEIIRPEDLHKPTYSIPFSDQRAVLSYTTPLGPIYVRYNFEERCFEAAYCKDTSEQLAAMCQVSGAGLVLIVSTLRLDDLLRFPVIYDTWIKQLKSGSASAPNGAIFCTGAFRLPNQERYGNQVSVLAGNISKTIASHTARIDTAGFYYTPNGARRAASSLKTDYGQLEMWVQSYNSLITDKQEYLVAVPTELDVRTEVYIDNKPSGNLVEFKNKIISTVKGWVSNGEIV